MRTKFKLGHCEIQKIGPLGVKASYYPTGLHTVTIREVARYVGGPRLFLQARRGQARRRFTRTLAVSGRPDPLYARRYRIFELWRDGAFADFNLSAVQVCQNHAEISSINERPADRAIPKIIGDVRGGAVGIVATILARHRSRASFWRPQ